MGIFLNSTSKNSLIRRQDGQILLIVVLAAIVSLTVGLSAVSRSITNTKLSTEEASSQKALSAAEAGVEKLLNNASVGSSQGTFSNNSTFNALAQPVSSNFVKLNDGDFVLQDEGADVWLTDDNKNFTGNKFSGNLTVYWTDNDAADCTKNAFIEVALLSGADKNNPNIERYAYGSCGDRADDGFLPPSLGSVAKGTPPVTYSHGFTISSIQNGYIARIIPIYANTTVAVEASGGNLPPQGNTIVSTGSSGNTSRKIRVFQGYPRIPIEFFPYNLFLPI